jgi:hypothetical protein
VSNITQFSVTARSAQLQLTQKCAAQCHINAIPDHRAINDAALEADEIHVTIHAVIFSLFRS